MGIICNLKLEIKIYKDPYLPKKISKLKLKYKIILILIENQQMNLLKILIIMMLMQKLLLLIQPYSMLEMKPKLEDMKFKKLKHYLIILDLNMSRIKQVNFMKLRKEMYLISKMLSHISFLDCKL